MISFQKNIESSLGFDVCISKDLMKTLIEVSKLSSLHQFLKKIAKEEKEQYVLDTMSFYGVLYYFYSDMIEEEEVYIYKKDQIEQIKQKIEENFFNNMTQLIENKEKEKIEEYFCLCFELNDLLFHNKIRGDFNKSFDRLKESLREVVDEKKYDEYIHFFLILNFQMKS